jgi:uncharacterized membrane protein
MGKLSALLYGLGIGAGLMYFLDPDNGVRRKNMVRERAMSLQNRSDEAIEMATRDLRNRTIGFLSEGMTLIGDQDLPDAVLEERIRTQMGRMARHPGGVRVRVENKQAILEGDVLQDEVDGLINGITRMRGITGVRNNTTAHMEAGDIQTLQGPGSMAFSPAAGRMSPSTRLLAGMGALYLFTYGSARGGIIGFFAKIGSLILGSRVLTNMNLRSMATGAEDQPVQVHKSISVNAPVNEVYGLWANFENFPRFMDNIEEIHDMGNGRSHWVVKGPAGSRVEFDAQMVENVPNELVAWKTTPDSQVKHSGEVRFKENRGGKTQINVNMEYSPPAGAAGHVVAKIFGKDPKSEMDADLARFKSLMEQGKTTAKNQEVKREQVVPVTGETNRSGQMNEGQEMTDTGPLNTDDLSI